MLKAANPVLPIAALVLAALVFVSASGGGYFPGDWYPPALYTLALVAMALLWAPSGRAPARPVLVACWALAGYAAWSYLSIAWAVQKGDAWDGANRAALYALIFAVCALWPVRGRAALRRRRRGRTRSRRARRRRSGMRSAWRAARR